MKRPVASRPFPTTEHSIDREVIPPVSSSRSLVTSTFLFACILASCEGMTASMLLVFVYPRIPSDSLLCSGPVAVQCLPSTCRTLTVAHTCMEISGGRTGPSSGKAINRHIAISKRKAKGWQLRLAQRTLLRRKQIKKSCIMPTPRGIGLRAPKSGAREVFKAPSHYILEGRFHFTPTASSLMPSRGPTKVPLVKKKHLVIYRLPGICNSTPLERFQCHDCRKEERTDAVGR